MEKMVEKGTLMTFSAEMLEPGTKAATTTRPDGAITFSLTYQDPDATLVTEIHVALSREATRELAKKLVKRLSDLHLW